MPLAGTSPLSRANAHYRWAMRYNDKEEVHKSLSHLDRAMAYGAAAHSKGKVYARANSAFFYHVTDTTIGVYQKRHMDKMYSSYVRQERYPRAQLSLTVKTGGIVAWPSRPPEPRLKVYLEFEESAAKIQADVRSICETKLGWKRIFLHDWPDNDDDTDEARDSNGEWREYPSVKDYVKIALEASNMKRRDPKPKRRRSKSPGRGGSYQ